MSSTSRFSPATALRALLAVAAAIILSLALSPAPASSHGSAITPPSRHFGCWDRWGSDFQNPAMATLDPMCWQAWQTDTNAMWNWNGLYREGVGGNHEAAIPNGQLCSGGRTGNARYRAMDVPGAWKVATVGTSFTFVNHDQARHGADYYRIYVTKQGFDPLTEQLGWDDLELRTQTGVIPPGQGQPSSHPALNGVSVSIPVTAPGRTGRHIVYMVWQASHFDQSFYSCSDVIFS